MPTVYVTQQVLNRDVKPATKFGDLRILFPPGDHELSYDMISAACKHELRDMKRSDYLLLMGDPVLISVVSMHVSRLNFPTVDLLKWSKVEKCYHPFTIIL